MAPDGDRLEREHTVSIVVPVFRGANTLDLLIKEIRLYFERCKTPAGRYMRVAEVLLVHDGGNDGSDGVMRRLAEDYPWVRLVWLSRNFGQHAATIAGMASTGFDWIVTMDEDGQFDPRDIGRMLDVALENAAQLVYGISTIAPSHGTIRNIGSRLAKTIATKVLTDGTLTQFSSYRLMLGEIGRGAAAYVGPGAYLDVALGWTFGQVAFCPVQYRTGVDRPSGYSFSKLLSHFWRLVISSGPRPLRIVSAIGLLAAIGGLIVAVALVVAKFAGNIVIQGWTSLTVIVLLLGGLNLLALGVVAEYIGAAVRMAMGRPLYLVTSDPANGPLSRNEKP